MSESSGLAAVHEAAESISRADHEAAVARARDEGAAAGRAEAAASLAAARAEGAQAERQRIAGIEAHALPGHEALVAAMKADGSVTPDMAAGRILAAERALRDGQMSGIRDVEKVTGLVPAAPSSESAAHKTATEQMADKSRPVEDRCKAVWETDAAVRAEFGSLGAFTAFQSNLESGKIRLLRK